MFTRLIAIVLGVLALAVLSALVSESRNSEILEPGRSAPVASPAPLDTKPNCDRPKQEQQAGEIISNVNRLTYRNYLIQTRYRMANLDVPREYGPPPKPVKVSYVVVKRDGKLIAGFDGDIFFPLGNSAEAGFFELLNNGSKQLIVSQDIFRTGVQWVADFSKEFKIIFNGQKFLVGRESYDMTISDLNSDGVNEITVPITAFYGFEGWRLWTGDTPLPAIIFKYDPKRREYLPANPHFKDCLLRNIETADKAVRAESEPTLGDLMSVTLDYVFAGEESRGWSFFDETCKLPDKSRIKSDMQKVLNEHPVYRYLHRKSTARVN